jgi:hypothetical protein
MPTVPPKAGGNGNGSHDWGEYVLSHVRDMDDRWCKRFDSHETEEWKKWTFFASKQQEMTDAVERSECRMTEKLTAVLDKLDDRIDTLEQALIKQYSKAGVARNGAFAAAVVSAFAAVVVAWIQLH